jgi:hypothetical protein
VNSALQNEYLEALGIDVWVPRAATCTEHADDSGAEHIKESRSRVPAAGSNDAVAGIVLGPGKSSTLFLCDQSAAAATPIAADISRSLDCEPVWSWPAQDDAKNAMPLKQAIGEGLFTRVLIFGADLLSQDDSQDDEIMASARILRTETIRVLTDNARARQQLWSQLAGNGWCA